MKKINTLVAILVIIFAVNTLKAQTYPLHQFSIHIHGGYTMALPDLKGEFPGDLLSDKDPRPYFINNGFNFGADGKYYIDKKRTFGLVLSFTYSMLSSGDKAIDQATPYGTDSLGTGTYRFDMNIFTIGFGAEYNFAPKRPAQPFVNAQFTTNIIGGSIKYDPSGSFPGTARDNSMESAVRFGAMFGAGVNVKLSRSVGIIIGGRYAFANLFGKDSTGSYFGEDGSSTYGLNDKETTKYKSRKMPYLQFYAGVSFYLGVKPKPVVKK